MRRLIQAVWALRNQIDTIRFGSSRDNYIGATPQKNEWCDELFGGFPRVFYEAYEETYPLDAGYRQRKHLYNLYHLLNHLNLFGAGYLSQVKETLGLLRRSL